MALACARRYKTTDRMEFAMQDLWRLSAADIAAVRVEKLADGDGTPAPAPNVTASEPVAR